MKNSRSFEKKATRRQEIACRSMWLQVNARSARPQEVLGAMSRVRVRCTSCLLCFVMNTMLWTTTYTVHALRSSVGSFSITVTAKQQVGKARGYGL